MNNSPISTIWNADEEIIKTLMFYITSCSVALTQWDLEAIYKTLNSIDVIAYGKFAEDSTYQQMMNEDWLKMEQLRRKYFTAKNEQEYEQLRIEFYNTAKKIFKQFGVLCKHHGIYFREGKDPAKAALRT